MTDPIALPGAPLPMSRNAAANPDAERQRMRHVAEEFESVFLAEMLAPMFEGLDTDGLGGGGMGEEVFRPMLIERYAQSIAHAGGVGVADSIMSELMRLQAASMAQPEQGVQASQPALPGQTALPLGDRNGADR